MITPANIITNLMITEVPVPNDSSGLSIVSCTPTRASINDSIPIPNKSTPINVQYDFFIG